MCKRGEKYEGISLFLAGFEPHSRKRITPIVFTEDYERYLRTRRTRRGTLLAETERGWMKEVVSCVSYTHHIVGYTCDNSEEVTISLIINRVSSSIILDQEKS